MEMGALILVELERCLLPNDCPNFTSIRYKRSRATACSALSRVERIACNGYSAKQKKNSISLVLALVCQVLFGAKELFFVRPSEICLDDFVVDSCRVVAKSESTVFN